MAKRKNLSKEDIEDVSTFEVTQRTNLTNNKINLQDIPIHVKCLNERQKELKKAIEEKDIIISKGAAGCGKTYLSLLTSLHLLKTEETYHKIVLIKSLQVIKGEEVGFLKGTLEEKIAPFMYSFTGNLDKIFNSPIITKSLIEQGIIELYPIAYTRGVTWDKCIIIVDETQNIDIHTFRTLITRIGTNSKMIFLGDVEQVDRKNKYESCLDKVCNLFKNTDFASVISFRDDESVRNPLIPKILDILKNEE